VANCDLSRRWAASTADTIAPSRAERSHISSVARNFRARLKKAAGPFEALTAITCLGGDPSDCAPLESDEDAEAFAACKGVGDWAD